jgi:hypothetical protein
LKRCPECGLKHDDVVLTCDCGADLGRVISEDARRDAREHHHREADDEPESSFLALGLRIFAILAFVGGVVGFLALAGTSMLVAVYVLFGAVLSALILGALSAGLELLCRIEWNTRSE